MTIITLHHKNLFLFLFCNILLTFFSLTCITLFSFFLYFCTKTYTGKKFSEICKINDKIFEGTIIRCMRRLEEFIRQMCLAAKVIGDTALEGKFVEAIAKIKRDIIFAASLYL